MTLENFILIIRIQTILSGFIVILCLLFFKRREPEVKLIGLIFFLSVASHLSSMDIFQLKGKDINIPGSIYGIVSFVAISLLYNKALNNKYSRHFFIVTLAFCVFGIINLLFIQKNGVNSYSNTISSILLILYSIFYYYRLLIDLPVQHIQRVPMFWFNAAFLIYHGGALFLFVFTHYLVEVLNNNMLIYWSFHNILNIIHQLIIVVGIWQELRNMNPASPKSVL